MSAALPGLALSQASGSISGTATDPQGAPIVDVEVSVEGTYLEARSNAKGEFHVPDVPAGRHTVSVRRLGFSPRVMDVEVAAGERASIAVRLQTAGTVLSPVVVRGKRVRYTGRLAGYYERLERKAGGVFITREQIDRENPRALSQMITRVAGVSSARRRGGSGFVRMRDRTCAPLVWLDGTAMPSGDVDLDSFSPQSIEGVELYLGSTTPPVRFILMGTASTCGTILLWSRGPDTELPRKPAAFAADLRPLLATQSVFGVEDVDEPATRAPTDTVTIPYPQSLLATGVRGLVVAEFVVDTAGRVEPETLGIVSSTHAMFTEAVERAVEQSQYVPAKRAGRPVRQLVHQPFSFVPVDQRADR